VPLVARSTAQISLIPLGVPATPAVFVVILQRSGFGLAVAFSDASTTLSTRSDEVVSPNQIAAENTAAHEAAIDTAPTSPR
jgi:hypothetical protein